MFFAILAIMKKIPIQIHQSKPADFKAKVEVAACYLELNGQVLLLQRSAYKDEGGSWGVPAGKLDCNETPEEAAKRELFEETGIHLTHQLQSLSTFYIRKPEIDYVYHAFKVHLTQIPAIHLSNEHQKYHWACAKEFEELELMAGAKEILQLVEPFLLKKRKGSTVVSVYLLLRQKDEICLLLRQNTGYNDGRYGLIAGHVEDGESAIAGMIREASEEAGLELTASQLSIAHVMHRKTKENRLGIDIFFNCHSWNGKLENKEPHKCAELAFCAIQALPANTIPYIAQVIQAVEKGEFYSEEGWIE